QEGMHPIAVDLRKVDALQNANQIISLLAGFHSHGISSLFNFSVFPDLKKSDEYISYIGQGGLGLPDRDYYLKDDEKSKQIRDEYLKHISKMFELAGRKSVSEQSAKTIMSLETELAKVSMTRVELRDDEKQYHKFTLAELQASYPDINWQTYFNLLGANGINNLIVTQPDFFSKVNVLLKSVSLTDWKTYLTWNVINEAADKLNSVFEKQNFYFYSTVLEGTKEMRPRWKRMVGSTNGVLGEAVGQLYVAKVFSAEAKQKVNIMVDNLMAVYKERIQKLDWMGEETKKHALAKLASFSRKLGYPDKWKDYSPLTITRESFLKNYTNAVNFEFNRMITKLGKPIDKTEWGMSPQTVNAYYNPLFNEIVFPAAIMQPPFFYADGDDAVNYGAMGAVIGHEITHGFDDQGSKYDEKGNLNNWWTEEDRERFNKRTAKLVEQYNNITVLENLNVNGELTLGENIADLGGLTMAFAAYKKSLGEKAGETIDEFTPEQRFFLGWAQAWRTQSRPEALRQLILTNPHSPGQVRAVVSPSNMLEFYKAFGARPGHKMFKSVEERAMVW
ncbi:MAG: M13 family metallopeptidase, partial [Bacteroidia bacterium]|nr:M13 family metallopeptidase [Bacteroidia bacterium]